MDLTEFLLARVAEDQAAAEAVIADMPRWDDPDWERAALEVGDSLPGPQHSARWSPARALAECEAKKVAVDWYLNDDDTVMSATVKAMAAVYADHPDYRQEW